MHVIDKSFNTALSNLLDTMADANFPVNMGLTDDGEKEYVRVDAWPIAYQFQWDELKAKIRGMTIGDGSTIDTLFDAKT